MARPEDWPERLDAYVRQHERTPFAWGVHDCCTFGADWVREITGVDPMAAWRDQYRTPTAAARLIEQAGGLEAMVQGVLGMPIGTGFRQRGDVVLGEGAFGPTIGLVLGVDAAFAGLHGIERRLIGDAWKVWRV